MKAKLFSLYLKNCRKLDLSYTKITFSGIKQVLTLKQLKNLAIWSGCKYDTKDTKT